MYYRAASLALAQLVKSIPTTTGKVDFFNILIPTLELFFVMPENELFFT
jgi:hypothetical protein